MMGRSRIAVLILLATVIASTAPVSAIFYAQGQNQESTAEKFVELADGAGQKVKDLIDLVYANETALQTIEDAGFLDELEGNVTLYYEGLENVTNAYDALAVGDYEGAIANATEALSVFREVFSSIHIILCNSGLQKGHLVDAQGLLEAIRRAIEKIERLREILPENATEAVELLDQAEAYLDIDLARTMLLEGKVSEVVYNLTQANQLISQVYHYLKAQAEATNTLRICRYLEFCERERQRSRERFRLAANEGVNVTAALESLGYQNENEFMQTLENMIQTAQGKTEDITNVIQDLETISQTIREMDRAITQETNRYRERYGSPQGSGSGYGQGYGSGQGTGGDWGSP